MAGPRVTDLTERTASPPASGVLYIVIGSTDYQIQVSTLLGSSSTQTSDYTITKNKETVLASGEIAVTLPAASSAWECWIKNIGTSKVTIEPGSGDTIEGQASFILGSQYEGIHLKSDGGTLWTVF